MYAFVVTGLLYPIPLLLLLVMLIMMMMMMTIIIINNKLPRQQYHTLFTETDNDIRVLRIFSWIACCYDG